MKFMKLARTAGIAASMALMLGGIASAGSTSQNMGVSADISDTCSFGTVNTLAFGAYDPVVTNASTDLTTSTTFGLTCTSGDAISIGLSLGANAVSTQRYMVGTADDKLSYNLYQNSSNTTAWNDSSSLYDDTGTGSSVTYTVYGVVPHGQNEPADTYSDTVSIDVTY